MNLRLSILLFLAGCLWGTVQAASTFAPSSDATFYRGGATRAAWGAQPARQKITVRTTPRQQQQQQKKETKEAMDAFLTRDSRATFIGTYKGLQVISRRTQKRRRRCCCSAVTRYTHTHSHNISHFQSLFAFPPPFVVIITFQVVSMEFLPDNWPSRLPLSRLLIAIHNGRAG